MIKRLRKEINPVLQDIILDRVTKYLTGTRQTKFIVHSSSTHQSDYWDHIRQVRGDQEKTTEDQEDNNGNYKETRRRSGGITCYEESSSKTDAN